MSPVIHHEQTGVCPACEDKLQQVHPMLAGWVRRRKVAHPNLHVSWGARGPKDQMAVVVNGKSKMPWPKSRHNRLVQIDMGRVYRPELYPNPASNARLQSAAVDLFVISEEGEALFPWPFYEMISQESKDAREPVLWGHDFKTNLEDGDHFELTSEFLAT